MSNRTATQRRSRVFSSQIFTITVSGTDSSAPSGPQAHPQKSSDRITTSVDRPSRRPNRLGSRMFPKSVLIAT